MDAQSSQPQRTAPLVLPWEASAHREKLSAHGVTIVVPVFNEEKGVAGVMDRLSKWFLQM